MPNSLYQFGLIVACSSEDLGISQAELTESILEKSFPASALPECRAVSRAIFEKGISNCFRSLLSGFRIKIDWTGGVPAISENSVSSFYRLLDYFDLDVLLCADLARSGWAPQPSELVNWGVFPHFASADLYQLLLRGVADIHVHLGGSRHAGDVWRRLLLDEFSVSQLPEIRGAPSGPKWREAIIDASEARKARLQASRCADWKMFLAEERSHCVRELVRLSLGDDDSWRYVRARNLLWCAVRQPAQGASPGLHEFSRRWFRRIPRSSSLKSHRRRPFYHKFVEEHRGPLQHFLSSTILSRVEFRLSPFSKAGDYDRLTRDWRKSDMLGESRADVGFAVHFQRDLGRKQGESGPLIDERLRESFDRFSAALHWHRLRDLGQRSVVKRIDLASVEREGPAREAAPFFKLLRGDVRALELLNRGAIAKGHLAGWRRLSVDSHARLDLRANRLGASCHCGEDASVQLCGLKEIADAIDGMGLTEGDSIGHALMLAWDSVDFDERYGSQAVVRVREIFETLLWLILVFGDARLENGVDFLTASDLLCSISSEVFGSVAAGALFRDLGFARAFRSCILAFPLLPHAGTSAQVMAVEYLTGDKVFYRASRQVFWHDRRERALFLRVTNGIAEYMRKMIGGRRIVVEVHPSSNLRVAGVASLDNSPTLALLTNTDGMLCVIGTDDPGVFATTVELEYALVANSLGNRGFSRLDVLRILESSRSTGVLGVRWPGAPDRISLTD